jgi:hypothetical protein
MMARILLEETDMNTRITFEEKRHAKNLIRESEKQEYELLGKWGGSALMLLGGAMIVFIIMFALANPGATNIPMVLVSGTSNGVLLLFFGAYGLHISKTAREKRILAGLLQKLMA